MISLLPLALAFAQSQTAYLTPHGLGAEDTYTITLVMKLLPPCDPAGMTDAFQDVRLIKQEDGVDTVSITLFPLNDAVRQRRMKKYSFESAVAPKYSRPSVTCNFDPEMKRKLIDELKSAGIDPAMQDRRKLVAQVANYALARSRFVSSDPAMPADWYVWFPHGAPEVYPPVRGEFDAEKPTPQAPDSLLFDQQLIGKAMFAGKVHGACTSTSIYLTTILRALGFPTRTLFFVPGCDGNDANQVQLLTKAVRRFQTRQQIADGIPEGGFANHMFNEVWIDGQWVRLNYSRLDQEIVDPNYLGLMVRIETVSDISEVDLAKNWGLRAAKWPNVPTRLSSVNPYMLLAASDHWGANASKDNPPALEITHGTVIAAEWAGDPGYIELGGSDPGPNDFLVKIREWIPNRSYHQLREFLAKNPGGFVLRSPGAPDVHTHLTGYNFSNASARGFGVAIDNADRPNLKAGVSYTLVPLNPSPKALWSVIDGVHVAPRQR